MCSGMAPRLQGVRLPSDEEEVEGLAQLRLLRVEKEVLNEFKGNAETEEDDWWDPREEVELEKVEAQ